MIKLILRKLIQGTQDIKYKIKRELLKKKMMSFVLQINPHLCIAAKYKESNSYESI